MATGTVKKLVRGRGFGFITAQDGSEVFPHSIAIEGGAFDSLTAGQNVEFNVERGEKGPRAANVLMVAPGAERNLGPAPPRGSHGGAGR